VDRFDSMSIFVAVAEAGGFSAAARRLRVPLATVSRKVSELEAHLKIRLFNRSTRHVALTESGRAFHRSCRRILADLEEAERAAAGEYLSPRGELIVTAPVVFGRLHLVPIVSEFLAAYPDVEVQLQLADRVLDLLDEHIDVALRIGELKDSSMIAIRVGEVRRVVCASPGYLAKRGRPDHPRALVGHDCVTFANLDSPREWAFSESGRSVSHAVKPRFTVTTAEAAIDAAVAGAGITRLLSYQVARAIDAGSLSIILEDFEPAPMPVNLAHAGGRLVAQKLRAFLDMAVPRLRTRLAAPGDGPQDGCARNECHSISAGPTRMDSPDDPGP
jgi:DNA-binding transcriptional LysR family regulator